MILTETQIAELKEASKPLMKLLSEKYHPHIKVIVESDSSEIVEGLSSVKNDLTINLC